MRNSDKIISELRRENRQQRLHIDEHPNLRNGKSPRKVMINQIEEVSENTKAKHRHSCQKKPSIVNPHTVQNAKAQTLFKLAQKNATW